MPHRDTLLQDIDTNINAVLIPSYKSKASASDAFEAYILSIIIQAAVQEGAILPIKWEDTDETITTDITFRRSPGYINSKADKYTHAVLEFPNADPLEVHLGIYAIGVANIPQECDIAVVTRSEAKRCRRITNGNISIKSTHVLIGVECKCYESSKISLGLGRSFLGLTKDFSSRGKLKSKFFFVFNNVYKSVEKLLSHHDQEWEHNLTPTSTKEIERLRNKFQTQFQKYKAKS